jgi:hypothetical protein
MAQDYRDLVVWQKAIELTVCIYKLTQSFPTSEVYGLSSQMRKASVSIASNKSLRPGSVEELKRADLLGTEISKMLIFPIQKTERGNQQDKASS